MTSHDCVAHIRRLLRLKRVGHGGTLDPAATGVLPVALGKATRLLQFMRQDKAYRATIRLGVTTTTDDMEGEILPPLVETRLLASLELEEVTAALQHFVGKIQQVPPAYSAIQVQGKRLYDLARRGEAVEVPAREVEVYKIEILEWRSREHFPEIEVAIACGPGTYIRAIARDLGAKLTTGGTLKSLIRTDSSGFGIANSLTFEDLETQLEQGTFQPISPVAALAHLSAVTLPAIAAKRWCQGQHILDFRLPFIDVEKSNISPSFGAEQPNFGNEKLVVRVHDENAHFLGIGEIVPSETKSLVPKMVFEPIS